MSVRSIFRITRSIWSGCRRALHYGDRLVKILFLLLPTYLLYRGDWQGLGAITFILLALGLATGRRGGGLSAIERDDRDFPYRRRPIHHFWRH